MAEANAMLTLEALTFQTARAALEQGAQAIQAGETVFDLAGIQAADSSGVAMLLAWQRRAQAAGQRLRFINMPDNVHKLAILYGVDSLLPQD
ncbi:STAS domain-containing protein [Massilia sp. DD77]|uniref:STAS domain-containing protein n=1 Tax=Massilia sp. DD77 TaxID=3109349 RepID=UPI002FFF524E